MIIARNIYRIKIFKLYLAIGREKIRNLCLDYILLKRNITYGQRENFL